MSRVTVNRYLLPPFTWTKVDRVANTFPEATGTDIIVGGNGTEPWEMVPEAGKSVDEDADPWLPPLLHPANTAVSTPAKSRRLDPAALQGRAPINKVP